MSYNVRDHIGQRTTVSDVFGGYRLPAGLEPGDEVTLLEFQPGYWTVERNGNRFRVAMTGVGDCGMLPYRRKLHPGCIPRARRMADSSGFDTIGVEG